MQQRTIKELTVRKEEQEAMERRVKIQQEISDREKKLRSLVEDEETIKSEIIGKGDKIKTIETEQMDIEKELVRLKQEQKHMREKIRLKDKQRVPKSTPSTRVSFVSPEDKAKK